ncbi:MAG TPA: exodeoxyribonuclease V subunit alpha [Rhodanobacteraceae bacterium]|nr:exodeoxyribonuclease V subunit alpha [Rhodanobacteraceae bacterium]
MNAVLRKLAAARRLRRVDGALGDWLARAYPDAPPEAALAAALAARAIADGHSALALDLAQTWLDGLAGDGSASGLPEASAWCDALRQSPAVHVHDGKAPAARVPLVLDAKRRVYLRRYFDYELGLAQALITRAAGPDTGSRVPSHESRADGIDPEQQRAIDTALAHRFTLVTGGPGTGKTHSVVRMLVALARQAHTRGETLRIALAAPTGKAAARLSDSVHGQLARLDLPPAIAQQIPDRAGTVHRLIGLSPWQARPRFDRASPLPVDVLVVDEVSMVDLPLMAKLVDAVPEHARLILLGDPDQLAAVEAGNVLGALVEATDGGPLQHCHAPLVRSHRFGEGSALAALSAAIACGDADAALRTLAENGDATLVGHDAKLPDEATARYRAVLDAPDPAEALRAARGFRVLTALRQGPSGCIAIDRAIAQRLQRAVGVRADAQWWRGRLLLVTANRPELDLFNGDTGVVWPDANGTLKAWFDGPQGVLRALAPAVLPPHEGAFALTVHKAQGSEFDRVALVTGPDSAVLTRELLYTGITRARSGIAVYSTADTLRAGIGRRTLRMTGLADRLREAAATPISIAKSSPAPT